MNSFHVSPELVAEVKKHFAKASDSVYLYDKSKIKRNSQAFVNIPYPHKKIHFATMANINQEFLQVIREQGILVFVNSVPHLEKVMQAGFKGNEIIFTASAMSCECMKIVAESNAVVNLDSLEQIEEWKRISGGKGYGVRCNIGDLVRARKTRAGYFLGKNSRLGLQLEELKVLKNNKDVKGLHLYVGTDIMDIEYFLTCYRKLAQFVDWFPGLEYLDFGGGFGIEDVKLDREFDITEFGEAVSKLMKELSTRTGRNLTLILEPGRILGGKAGYFACKCSSVKKRQNGQLIGVNASVAQFPRPLFYPDTAVHPVQLFDSEGKSKGGGKVKSYIHGCSTYSRDFLARGVLLPAVSNGDILLFGHAGSYCASSYTEFLGFPKPVELFI